MTDQTAEPVVRMARQVIATCREEQPCSHWSCEIARACLAQAKEIEGLQKEAIDDAKLHAQTHRNGEAWQRRAEKAEARCAELVKALRKHGQHIKHECGRWAKTENGGWYLDDLQRCTCGLDQELAGVGEGA